MRVVLDTNVLISAFLFEKRLGKIVELIEQGVITPCFVVHTFREFQNVLGYEKFKPLLEASHITIDKIVEDMHAKSIILDDPKNIPHLTSDTGDNYVLAAAKSAQAVCIVTGDKLLLSLKYFSGVPIIAPKKFLDKVTRGFLGLK